MTVPAGWTGTPTRHHRDFGKFRIEMTANRVDTFWTITAMGVEIASALESTSSARATAVAHLALILDEAREALR